MRFKLVPILWIMTCVTQALAAHTRLETVGQTYPIVEQDIREEVSGFYAKVSAPVLAAAASV